MDKNYSNQIAQYAKLETLYKTINYLQKEIAKEIHNYIKVFRYKI